MSGDFRRARSYRELKIKRSPLAYALAFLGATLWLVSTGVTVDAQERQSKQMTNVTLALDFIPLGRHAPWYLAQEKGYYRDEGLNVNIIGSKGTGNVLALLQGGAAQFGLIDAPSMVLARAQGAKIKIVAVVYQNSPIAIFSLDPGANVTEAKDLVGLKIGTGPETFVLNLIQGFMKQKGLDPNSIIPVNIAPPTRIPMLVTRQVPAIHLFTMSEPAIENAAKDANVKMYVLADHGFQLYSISVGVTEDLLKANPQLVRGFLRASFRGWQYSMRHLDEAATIQKKSLPTLDPRESVQELNMIHKVVVVPDTQANGYGYFSKEKMKSTYDFMMANVGTGKKAPPKVEDLYATGYLPNPPIKP